MRLCVDSIIGSIFIEDLLVYLIKERSKSKTCFYFYINHFSIITSQFSSS